MPLLKLNGVTVDFPFTPYDCQKDYMTKVLECLKQSHNGVLESPTGTGKTLCLLCATLAWREHFKDAISARKISEKLKGAEMFPNTPFSSWGTAATDGDKPVYYTDIPKIIYASRTHSQLAQVISELKNTTYRPKVCVLGSREQLCINQEVMRQESNHVKVHMCRDKVSTRSCGFYNNVEERSSDRELLNSILDVEDLVKFGNKQRVCPYFLTRSLKQHADIIFMPYNYLLDPKSRRAHNIELNKAVVIFDEAHNVERMCEESTSFDLTPYDVASAITAVDRLLEEKAKEVSRGDPVTEDINVESLSSGSKLEVPTIAKVKQILLDLEAAIDSIDVPSEKGITKPGIFIYELLEKAHLTYSTKTAVYEALEQIIGSLTGKPGAFLNSNGLQKLADIIQLVFSGEPSELDRQRKMESYSAYFKVHIHRDTSAAKKKQAADPWASASSKKQGNILSYWCFSPGFSMQELVNQGVRCIILTSGTLSPLTTFTSEMRIDFPVLLENGHVISRDQIYVRVLDQGPDSVVLSSAFNRRFIPEVMASLGNTVANLCRLVPRGLLVFFPSFLLMEKTLELWRTKGQASHIEILKPMFVEPKGKGTFSEVINGYYSSVNDPKCKGGSFFAVCRGKASEGLDFADNFCRAVVITGLPFPPKFDPRVVLKMQYLDEMNGSKAPGVKFLSGQEWYRHQAFRAVNQAIGRVIRHKEDYGAIFLCDERFRSPDVRANLPSWVRPYVRVQAGFGTVVREVSQFFRTAQKMRPEVIKTPAAENPAAECSSSSCSSSSSSSCSSSSFSCVVAQKAKVLDAHLPSLKKRKLDEGGGASGMAKICISYEGEVPESQRRPANLLDALDQGERRRGDDDAAGGDEVTRPGVSLVRSSLRELTVLVRLQASRLSTLSLQYNKRLEDELRGGKRKIKLVHEQKTSTSEDVLEDGKTSRAKQFLADMKASLSKVTFDRIVQALQDYKKTDSLDSLLSETSMLADDENTHSLLRGFYQFIRPHHKKRFDEKCLELTGQGCGFKPDHSLSKDEKRAVMLQKSSERRPAEARSSSSSCRQLDTQQLNGGGPHLSQQGLKQPQEGAGSAKGNKVYAALIADVKEAFGAEKSSLLFQAIRRYKETDVYEDLVTTLVNMFMETWEHFDLLIRFGTFVRPHHKKLYKEMLDALIFSAARDPSLKEEQEKRDDI
ncbi:regulator of telomere elongation helicase 1 isoform X2 [Nothobranchius furzeri]|uniref:regulator of telomere elongation helicase 1 isoform X2 n=1 Tax=Nothobranchius furzeri TaxID=105023 RepID=UPI0039048CB3